MFLYLAKVINKPFLSKSKIKGTVFSDRPLADSKVHK